MWIATGLFIRVEGRAVVGQGRGSRNVVGGRGEEESLEPKGQGDF